MSNSNVHCDAADDDWGVSDSMLVEALQAFGEAHGDGGRSQPRRATDMVADNAADAEPELPHDSQQT